MSLNYLRIDSAIIHEIGQLDHIDEEHHNKILLLALQTLEGKEVEVSSHVSEIGSTIGASPNKLAKIITAVAALQWECAKFASKEIHAIRDMLLQLGVSEKIVEIFCEIFNSNRRLFLKLKGSLGMSEFSYHDLSWRLDVEIAKRNLSVTSDPKYLLRLDLINHASGSDDYQSVHLESDYANMKLLQTELQRALDEMNSVHCQRISRYIS